MTVAILVVLAQAAEDSINAGDAPIMIAVITAIAAIMAPVVLAVTQAFLGKRLGHVEGEANAAKAVAAIAERRTTALERNQKESGELTMEMLAKSRAQLRTNRLVLMETQEELKRCQEHRSEDEKKIARLVRDQALQEIRLHAALSTLEDRLGIPLRSVLEQDEDSPVIPPEDETL